MHEWGLVEQRQVIFAVFLLTDLQWSSLSLILLTFCFSASPQSVGNCPFRLTVSPITTCLSLSDRLQGVLKVSHIQKQLESSSLWKGRLWSHLQKSPCSYPGSRTLRPCKAIWSVLAHKMFCLTSTVVGQWTVGWHEGDLVMHYEPCKLHIPAQHLSWHHSSRTCTHSLLCTAVLTACLSKDGWWIEAITEAHTVTKIPSPLFSIPLGQPISAFYC